MSELGRPTKLDEHLFRKIRELVLDGQNLRQVSESLEIPYATMRDWEYENYQSFSDKMLSFKHQRMLNKAEVNIEALMGADDERIKLDASKFTAETIGKKSYSKQVNTDVTTGGKPIIIDHALISKHGTNTVTSTDSFGHSSLQGSELRETIREDSVSNRGDDGRSTFQGGEGSLHSPDVPAS